MHANEFKISSILVKNLLLQQFPQWVDLDLVALKPEGTDNVMYKLGGDKVVRLPRIEIAVPSLEKEILWLPKLASKLPIPVPKLIGVGDPSIEYPYPWFVYKLLEGSPIGEINILDKEQAAVDLGQFIIAMQNVKYRNSPMCRRGKPLSNRNQETREAINLSKDYFDDKLLTQLWDFVLKTPAWEGDPVWIHGDLHPGNLLVKDGRISAVLDFGLCGIGDPAADLMVAWTVLDKDSRKRFRSIVKPEDATWNRGYGWALALGIVGYSYYRERNPSFALIAKRTLDEVLSDQIMSD